MWTPKIGRQFENVETYLTSAAKEKLEIAVFHVNQLMAQSSSCCHWLKALGGLC